MKHLSMLTLFYLDQSNGLKVRFEILQVNETTAQLF